MGYETQRERGTQTQHHHIMDSYKHLQAEKNIYIWLTILELFSKVKRKAFKLERSGSTAPAEEEMPAAWTFHRLELRWASCMHELLQRLKTCLLGIIIRRSLNARMGGGRSGFDLVTQRRVLTDSLFDACVDFQIIRHALCTDIGSRRSSWKKNRRHICGWMRGVAKQHRLWTQHKRRDDALEISQTQQTYRRRN